MTTLKHFGLLTICFGFAQVAFADGSHDYSSEFIEVTEEDVIKIDEAKNEGSDNKINREDMILTAKIAAASSLGMFAAGVHETNRLKALLKLFDEVNEREELLNARGQLDTINETHKQINDKKNAIRLLGANTPEHELRNARSAIPAMRDELLVLEKRLETLKAGLPLGAKNNADLKNKIHDLESKYGSTKTYDFRTNLTLSRNKLRAELNYFRAGTSTADFTKTMPIRPDVRRVEITNDGYDTAVKKLTRTKFVTGLAAIGVTASTAAALWQINVHETELEKAQLELKERSAASKID
jgi:hypothetical protein